MTRGPHGGSPKAVGPATVAGAEEEDVEFRRRYGDWASLTPTDAARLLDGIGAPWWIAGGHAIEAFTGVVRRHEDVDVALFRADVPALRAHFDGRYHLWSAGSGALRPLSDRFPRQPAWSQQVWVREHAAAPWLMDLLTTEGDADGWILRWDHSYVRPLVDVTWTAADGLRYLAPELVLTFKARLDRPKDRQDFEAAWPLLDDDARAWLVATVGRLFPRCSWLPVLRGRGAAAAREVR